MTESPSSDAMAWAELKRRRNDGRSYEFILAKIQAALAITHDYDVITELVQALSSVQLRLDAANQPKLYNIRQAARRRTWKESTLRRAIESGVLPGPTHVIEGKRRRGYTADEVDALTLNRQPRRGSRCPPGLVSKAEFARRLRCCQTTVDYHIEFGRISEPTHLSPPGFAYGLCWTEGEAERELEKMRGHWARHGRSSPGKPKVEFGGRVSQTSLAETTGVPRGIIRRWCETGVLPPRTLHYHDRAWWHRSELPELRRAVAAALALEEGKC